MGKQTFSLGHIKIFLAHTPKGNFSHRTAYEKALSGVLNNVSIASAVKGSPKQDFFPSC